MVKLVWIGFSSTPPLLLNKGRINFILRYFIVTKEEIVSMPIEEYKNKFGKDPLEIIQSLENPTEDEIVQAMLDYANQVS